MYVFDKQLHPYSVSFMICLFVFVVPLFQQVKILVMLSGMFCMWDEKVYKYKTTKSLIRKKLISIYLLWSCFWVGKFAALFKVLCS